MQPDVRAALAYLCTRVLHPLVRILIRFGVSAGELKSIVDSVYARAGSEYLVRQGERVTYSRLAVITGINRAVLPGLLSAPDEADFRPRSTTQLHRAARVLAGWHDDRDFQTRAGSPAALPIQGARGSFEQLTRRYSGGVYYWTILSELERVGALTRVRTDKVRATRRSLSAGGASAESLYSAGEMAGDLMGTLERNLSARAHEQLPVRSLVLAADARSLALFRAQVGRRADALLEQIDSFLQSHGPERARGSEPQAGEKGFSLGAAVFAICRETQGTGSEAAPHRASKGEGGRRQGRRDE